MKLVDLTLPIPELQNTRPTVRTDLVPLVCADAPCQARVHHFRHDSMVGTYLDFPGHLVETDDGATAANDPPERFYRVRAAVVRLHRQSGSGGISAQELQAAAPPLEGCGALIINALGTIRFDAILYRSVFLNRDAVEWIISTPIHLLVSDVYESKALSEGVFPLLFSRRICTVCQPVNLHCLEQPYTRLTVLTPRFPKATQLPCRAVAEVAS
ncbi:MAG TPA: cyclase family protein [Chthoniobacteraceae bacterium]|nr:cyclase family protein [Chthoniobacteraceae bacterium]